MTLSRPMFPPRAESKTCSSPVQVIPPVGGISRGAVTVLRPANLPSIEGRSKNGNIDAASITVPAQEQLSRPGRRGFLRGLAALFPAAAVASVPMVIAPRPAPAAVPLQESRQLLLLAEQLDAAEQAYAGALTWQAEARQIAARQWPEVPESIVWSRSRDVPEWCPTHQERDIDDKPFYFYGNLRSGRQVADCYQLAHYADSFDLRTSEGRRYRAVLAASVAYEDAREAVIDASGYDRAKSAVRAAVDRIDEVAELIHKCEPQTYHGLAIKALAIMVAISTEASDHYVAGRAKLLHCEALARGVVKLQQQREA